MTPGQVKAIIAIVIIAAWTSAAFFAGWEWRDRSCDLASVTDQRDQAQAQTEAVVEAREDDKASQAVASEVEEDRVEAEAKTEDQFKIIYREVVRYVEANPDPMGCDLGPDGLRAWRAANAGRFDDAEPVDPGTPAEDRAEDAAATR